MATREEEIERIVGLLRSHWLNNPEAKLGQIIVGFTPRAGSCLCSMRESCDACNSSINPDPTYLKDNDLEQCLRQALAAPRAVKERL